ncbi:clavesin-2 [Stomoxys calcitrans]|uniref:CRAL-TRIO domain-containing protein n=1 Tax=Stomoxys calcitrans TaxID=35570 RepID=A0A1I8NMA5_STOCA|nr:clavesin-2 [Stomoxys calcitrans]XP_059221312.1 clavesin-2 [Stomoxys calcitrans]
MSEYFEISINRAYSNKHYATYFDNDVKDVNRNQAKNHQYLLKKFNEMAASSLNYALKEKSFCNDDSFLYRFLHARKFDCDSAMELLIKYLQYKQNNVQILRDINIFDEHIQLALRDGNPGLLSQRDRRGRKVVTFTAANWNTNKYRLQDIYRALLLTLDKLLEDVQNQALGFVIIVDWTNFTYRQSTHLTPKILKTMIEGLQDCMPIKFKGIHFIAQPWYVELALSVIKPFFKENIKERFYVHGTNLNSLHELVCKDILPSELGGETPNVNNLDWYHSLLDSSQSTEEHATNKPYRIIKDIVYSKPSVKLDDNFKDTNCSNSVKLKS